MLKIVRAASIGMLALMACQPTSELYDGNNPPGDSSSMDAIEDAAALVDTAPRDQSSGSPDTWTPPPDAAIPDASPASLCVPASNLIPGGALDEGMVGDA